MNKLLKWLLPLLTVLSLLYIFSNSLLTYSETEKKQDKLLTSVEKVVEAVTDQKIELDRKSIVPAKLAHVFEYTLFSFLLTFSAFYIHTKERVDLFQIKYTCLFVGLADEYLQSLGQGRGSRLTDVMIDFTACLVGLSLARLVYRIYERRKAK